MFLLCGCGGLQRWRDELHGLGVGRYGLGGFNMDEYGLGFVLDDGCGWYKGLDSSLCSE